MRNYPVIIPDAMTLTQFNSICSSFFSQQEKNEEENHQLSKLRDFLLPKLMSGEIAI
jgi:type I restriction enzyme S subunit